MRIELNSYFRTLSKGGNTNFHIYKKDLELTIEDLREKLPGFRTYMENSDALNSSEVA